MLSEGGEVPEAVHGEDCGAGLMGCGRGKRSSVTGLCEHPFFFRSTLHEKSCPWLKTAHYG